LPSKGLGATCPCPEGLKKCKGVKRGMPKVVKPSLLKIPARAWRAVRSFVESSLKDIYSWNIGVEFDGVAVFTKANKWVLRCWRDNSGLSHRSLELADGTVVVSVDADCIVNVTGAHPVSLSRPEFHTYFLVPDSDVPYAYPISLKDVVDKMLLYPTP